MWWQFLRTPEADFGSAPSAVLAYFPHALSNESAGIVLHDRLHELVLAGIRAHAEEALAGRPPLSIAEVRRASAMLPVPLLAARADVDGRRAWVPPLATLCVVTQAGPARLPQRTLSPYARALSLSAVARHSALARDVYERCIPVSTRRTLAWAVAGHLVSSPRRLQTTRTFVQLMYAVRAILTHRMYSPRL